MGQLHVPLMSTRPDAASQEPGIAVIDDGPLPSVVRLCNRLSVHRLGSMQGRSTGQSRKTRLTYIAIHMRALSRLPCERRHAPYRDGYRAVSTATQSIETRRSVRAAIAYLCATNGRRRTSAHAAASTRSCRESDVLVDLESLIGCGLWSRCGRDRPEIHVVRRSRATADLHGLSTTCGSC